MGCVRSVGIDFTGIYRYFSHPHKTQHLMKKVSALAIVLLGIVLLPCYSQVEGVDLTTAIPLSSFDDDNLPPYEQLIVHENGGYIMIFKKTPVGYKHCLDEAKRILSDNGKNFRMGRITDEVMYPPNIEGLTDYQNMPHELRMAKAEVDLAWELTDEYGLGVLCNDEVFSVHLFLFEE